MSPAADAGQTLAAPWGAVGGWRGAWPTPPQELLLRAALLADERGLDAWRRLRPQLEVAEVDGSAQAVLPLLRKNLTALGVKDEAMSLFKGVHRFNWARGQMLLHRMLPVVGELERAGISTLLLKGAALVSAQRIDAGMRAMNDVDVLVPTDQARAAIEVLVGQGLVPVGGVPRWYVEEYAPRFVPSHGFEDGEDRQLDLHWHALHWSCQPNADDDLWAASAPAERVGVRTRTLCPADELLLVILHGLRWNAVPTYRWVVDAALLLRGLAGAVDFDRLVKQSRLRRVVAPVEAGLTYLCETADAPVPEAAMRSLRSSRTSWLERVELRAQMTQPRRRGRLQRLIIEHQQLVRRQLSVGVTPTLAARLEIARHALGADRWLDLRHALAGGRPGPGRPGSEMAAALGAGPSATQPHPLGPGEAIDFGRADLAKRHVAHGTWLPEGEGCWIAGREARLVVGLPARVRAPLLLSLSADGLLTDRHRQRLHVIVNRRPVAALQMDPARPSLRDAGIKLSPEVLDGSGRLEVVLLTPDAASPAELGLADDDRRMGAFLRRLALREPPVLEVGGELRLGVEAHDEDMLGTGWGAAEPFGRWSQGSLAQVFVRLERSPSEVDLVFDALPFIGRHRRRLRVDVLGNGRHLGRHDYLRPRPSLARVPLGAAEVGENGELLLAWKIRNPASPASLGVSADARKLGIFLRSLTLVAAG